MGAIKVWFEVTLAAESENGLDFKYYAPFSQKNWIKIEFPHKKLHFFLETPFCGKIMGQRKKTKVNFELSNTNYIEACQLSSLP